jgi:plasmid stabilization system protein ParE
MGNLNWTAESVRWLSDIFEYIEAENPHAAQEVVSGIYQRAQVLLSHPEIGHRYQPSTRHVRILMYGHYRIAYLVKPGDDIDILGVFHGSLDISRYAL